MDEGNGRPRNISEDDPLEGQSIAENSFKNKIQQKGGKPRRRLSFADDMGDHLVEVSPASNYGGNGSCR